MTGRRSIVGLALLSALALCAFMAQSASAAFESAHGITAFTCAKGGGEEDFTDAHCDNQVEPFEGEYGHVTIPKDTTTAIESENTETAVLHGTLAGTEVTITAETVHGEGWIENSEPAAGEHTVTGAIHVLYTNLTVHGLECEVKNDEITVNAEFEAVEQGEESGLKFVPAGYPENKTFVTIEFAEGCVIPKVKVNGTTIATGQPGGSSPYSGATSVFSAGMSSLLLGGNAASLVANETTKMAGGDPIALTQVT